MAAFFIMNDDYKKLHNYVLSLLSRREYSTHKLKEKLISKKFSSENIDRVIEQVIEEGFLNEIRFSQSKMRTLAKKNYSKAYIEKYLENENIKMDSCEINQFFNEENFSEENQLNTLIEKKLRNIKEAPTTPVDLYRLKSKIISYLLSKGHSYHKIQAILSKKLSEI